jgi:SAM-dependent methyltransferase
MKHVLEHTPRPREALAEIRRVLRPCGGVYLAVPHAGYAKSLRNPGASRYYIPSSHGREHFVYYTPTTLPRLLREEGFEPVRFPHPDLWHRRAPLPTRLGKLAVAPLRLLGQRLREALGLYKELSVVAVRR